MWKVETWTISDVHAGYRVIRRGPRGMLDIHSGYIGDCYIPGSFNKAKAEAEAECARLNAAYSVRNVVLLYA